MEQWKIIILNQLQKEIQKRYFQKFHCALFFLKNGTRLSNIVVSFLSILSVSEKIKNMILIPYTIAEIKRDEFL